MKLTRILVLSALAASLLLGSCARRKHAAPSQTTVPSYVDHGK